MHHDLVRDAIARHLSVEPAAIERAHRLEQDWGLNSLDLVLVLARLEEIADFELPLELLRSIGTVGELSDVVAGCVRSLAARRAGPVPSTPSRFRETVRRTSRAARSAQIRAEARHAAVVALEG